jgi:ABC-type iron transport system FetAB permease component
MEAIVSITTLGLAFIVLGWAVQAISAKNKTEIQKNFLTWYGLGALLLVMDGFFNGLLFTPILNLVAFLLVVLLMFKVRK